MFIVCSYLSGALENNEDTGTLQYLASTAMEAGFCVTDKNGDVLTITIHAY